MSNDSRIAVDVAKAVFEIAISDRPGHVRHRERPARADFLTVLAQQPAATVVMEACGSAHYWGRRIELLEDLVVPDGPAVRLEWRHSTSTVDLQSADR